MIAFKSTFKPFDFWRYLKIFHIQIDQIYSLN